MVQNMVAKSRYVALGLLLINVAALAQAPRALPAAGVSPEKEVRLDIPDAGQEKRAPEEGWCGESAIQMALGYYGEYASQKAINRAGNPSHPDLNDDDIPTAMKGLGLEFKTWDGKGLQPFLTWIRGELAAGHPVLLGVKIYPTEHPDWDLDHFVLAAGCTKDSLTLNTTWGRQETLSIAQLSSEKEGLSFANPHNSYFGYSITGTKLGTVPIPAAQPGQPLAGGGSAKIGLSPLPIRLSISRNGDKQVELHIAVENLERGKNYRVMKFASLDAARQPDARAELLRSFAADGTKAEFVEKIGVDDARVYRCLPSSD